MYNLKWWVKIACVAFLGRFSTILYQFLTLLDLSLYLFSSAFHEGRARKKPSHSSQFFRYVGATDDCQLREVDPSTIASSHLLNSAGFSCMSVRTVGARGGLE